MDFNLGGLVSHERGSWDGCLWKSFSHLSVLRKAGVAGAGQVMISTVFTYSLSRIFLVFFSPFHHSLQGKGKPATCSYTGQKQLKEGQR